MGESRLDPAWIGEFETGGEFTRPAGGEYGRGDAGLDIDAGYEISPRFGVYGRLVADAYWRDGSGWEPSPYSASWDPDGNETFGHDIRFFAGLTYYLF